MLLFSGKAVSIPMLPLGLKETIDLDFADVFEVCDCTNYASFRNLKYPFERMTK